MAVLSNTGIRAGASGVVASDPYRIKRSARFNSGDSSYLNWTPAAAGNLRKWTWSGWVKRSGLTNYENLISINNGGSFFIRFQNNQLHFYDQTKNKLTTSVYRDVSAWYHVVIAIDYDNGSAADRVKGYVNGEQVEWGAVNDTFTSVDSKLNAALTHSMGRDQGGADSYADIYLADVHFIDGSVKAASDFGETDSTTGQWVPKEYEGSYGTNGFHLAMDPANGGTDYSSQLSMTNATGWSASPYGQDAGFNGIIGSGSGGYAQVTGGSDPNSITFTPTGGISYSSKVEVYIINAANEVSVNGGTLQSISANTWVTVASGSGTLTSLKFERASASGASFSGIRIDDKLLVDHTAIGYDSSGNDNHWHENNLFGREHTTASENFKAVTYEGNSGTQTISGLGFSPGLVWIKQTNATASHFIYDTVRGTQKLISSNYDGPENWAGGGGTAGELTAFTSDGFTLVNSGSYGGNVSGGDFVAWCWKAGGAASSNSDGSITSSVSANTTAGFSIVSYEGTGPSSSGTVGHGLGKKPDMIIAKSRDATTNWYVWHSSSASNINTKYALLNTTDKVNQSAGNLFATVGTTTFGVEAGSNTNNQDSMIAYCFTEIEGYSKFGHYIGNNNATGPIIDCGFTPAFVLFRRVDDDNNWQIFDNARSLDNDLKPNTSEAEGSAPIEFQPNGFQIKNTYTSTNASGGEYIYMAIAGPPGGDLDLLADTPGAPYDNELNGGGNYCTLNPLDNSGISTLSNGNLKAQHNANNWKFCRATQWMSTGKWYWESTLVGAVNDNNNGQMVGVCSAAGSMTISSSTDKWTRQGQHKNDENTNTSPFTSPVVGQIFGWAYDADAGKLWTSTNGVWEESGNPAGGTGENFTTSANLPVAPIIGLYASNCMFTMNFGQRTFAYTPPTGYKALNTYNLADPTITKGNTGFDVRSGNSAQFTVNDLNFQADLIVSKSTSNDEYWIWADAVRGFDKPLKSDTDAAEGSGDAYTSVGSSGFTTDSNWFTNGRTYVSYAWDAGSANVTNDASSTGVGTVDSTYRVNTNTGFSIVKWTGPGSGSSTVAHGLNAAPKFIIVKGLSGSVGWTVGHESIGWTKRLKLNTNDAASTSSNYWNDTAPTSSVFSSGANNVSNDFIAYLWSEVAGYSKFGTFEGNDNVNGPFIYCGFRPRFFMAKNIDATYSWYIFDTARSTYNWSDKVLYPDLNSAETTSGAGDAFDIVSNGIKLRGDGSNTINASGNTYVFAAFAESPFKYANAR